jgi:predicted enzyme involved in methoxymalonyl-ACP biosynthesis
MGKKVENAIIINIFKYLQSLNIKIVTINLVETEKNKSFVDIFNIHDFVIYDDNMTYIHKLSDKIYEYPIWFKKNNN